MDEKKIEELEQKQYIVVKLGSEQYGIDIQYVDNIVRMQRVTRVPKAQPYFKGVINIRGEVIPVMSLRLKFGLEPVDFKGRIDRTSGGNDERSAYLYGVGKQPDGLVSLLNIPAVVVEKEGTI